ncbi:MAG: long-chain-fatty-acid--CoA ligase [Cystobacter sp.]
MEKIWLKHYPSGVPAEIDDSRYTSLTHLMEESFREYADRPAFECMGRVLTYRELDALSRQVAAWLQARGLARGSTVAIMMPNVLPYPVCLAAILRAGYTVVNINPLYTARELEYQLKDCGAVALFILENFAATLEKVLERTALQHVVVSSMGDLLGSVKGAVVDLMVRKVKKLVPPFHLPRAVRFKQVLAESRGLTLTPTAATRDDVAFLQYTGGTTGVVKGATLLHRNVIANLLQTEVWLQPALESRRGKPIHIVCALPLYHIYALTVCALMGIRMGAMNILVPNPRDIAGFIKTLARQPFHIFPAVNTLFNALLHHPDVGTVDFSHLLCANGGGMAIQRAVAEKWFALTKVPLLESYGLSETSPGATSNPLNATEYSGSIGLPLPSTEVTIRDDEGRDVPLGEPGEICIRGPQVMAGYWKRPEETARVMCPDGFFKSGDIGVMDERGFIRIVDRKKDMILVSGFNVYPNEIEGVIALHPGVLEVAAVGVPDARSGEAVKLFVVKKDASLTEAQLLDYCREQFTAYKRPRTIEFRAELPKSNVGKILRRELRALAGWDDGALRGRQRT